MRRLFCVSHRVTDMTTLRQRLDEQFFPNDYQLVDGVAMQASNPTHFHVPPDVIKRQVRVGQFVELRIDSPRFFNHDEIAERCFCPTCEGALSKPILRHTHPASLYPLTSQFVPSRGWGEDFWVQITERDGDVFRGLVDNPLVESRLHGLIQGDEIVLHANHILAVHDIHRRELVSCMDEADLKELAKWLAATRRQNESGSVE